MSVRPVGRLVTLRPLTRADLELFDGWHLDGRLASEFDTFGLRRAERHRGAYEETGLLTEDGGDLVVMTTDGAEPVGDVQWHAVRYGPNRGSIALNIGITLRTDARGRGYGSEAQALLAAYLLGWTTANRIEASTDLANLAEQRALERAGFTREGVLRGAGFRAGAYHDMVSFSRLRSDQPPR